jgi:hypothetical protein
MIKALGGNQVQGFLLGRPTAASRLTAPDRQFDPILQYPN